MIYAKGWHAQSLGDSWSPSSLGRCTPGAVCLLCPGFSLVSAKPIESMAAAQSPTSWHHALGPHVGTLEPSFKNVYVNFLILSVFCAKPSVRAVEQLTR